MPSNSLDSKEFKMSCGVDQNLYQPYDFEDQLWRDKSHPMYNEMWYYLSHICVAMNNNGYLVKDKATDKWTQLSNKKSVVIKLNNERSGLVSLPSGISQRLGWKEIDEYINNYIPSLEAPVQIPFANDFVICGSSKRINVWYDNILRPEINNIQYLTEFLTMIRESLCAGEGTKDLNEMIAEITDPNGQKEYRFLMNWLAAIYQRPGMNLQTNLWLIGPVKGIGKGTLIRILESIFGSGVGKASVSDMERGWNNFIEGRLILEADEFKASNKADFNSMIKRDTTNPTISINARNKTPYSIPNITNWIFTTNDDNPLMVEDGDRRNVFIHTTNNEEWKQRSIELNTLLNNPEHNKKVATGFAAILSRIEIDYRLISMSFDTDIKSSMRAGSKNAVESWIDMDDSIVYDKWMRPNELFKDYYIPWVQIYFHSTTIKSIQAWGRQMGSIGYTNKRIQIRGVGPNKEYKILEP